MVLTPNAASMRQCREGHLPADPLHVRLIRVELESGEVEVLITSLRDTKAYPYCAFAKLYALRWGIEENYKLITSLQDFHGIRKLIRIESTSCLRQNSMRLLRWDACVQRRTTSGKSNAWRSRIFPALFTGFGQLRASLFV